MFYPTVLNEKTSLRHIVKDRQYCMCGSKYNPYATLEKRDFKRIEFKQEHEISCPSCKRMSH